MIMYKNIRVFHIFKKKLFYVPERDIMHLTVSARFLIRFDFRGGEASECIMFLNRTCAIKKYYAHVQ